jgi:hypothetical protein
VRLFSVPISLFRTSGMDLEIERNEHNGYSLIMNPVGFFTADQWDEPHAGVLRAACPVHLNYSGSGLKRLKDTLSRCSWGSAGVQSRPLLVCCCGGVRKCSWSHSESAETFSHTWSRIYLTRHAGCFIILAQLKIRHSRALLYA